MTAARVAACAPLVFYHAARWILLVLVTLLLHAYDADAQTNEETFQQFQWAFDTPGARAKGMGKAFIGVATDASATVTNPAGLVDLSRPQLYLELASINNQTNRVDDTTALASATATGTSQRTNSPAFIDIALPIRPNLTIGVTRHEFLNYRDHFVLEPRLLRADPDTGFLAVVLPAVGDTRFKAVNYGTSIAARVNSRLSVGATISFSYIEARSMLERYHAEGLSPRFDIPIGNTKIVDNDIGAAISLGALYRVGSRVSAGVVYSKGPFFTLTETLSDGQPFDVSLNVPERVGGGLGVRVLPRLLLAVDAVILRYSDLTKDIVPVLGGSDQNFTTDDRTELHFGSEYVLRGGPTPVLVRGGWFTNPDHSLRFTGTTGDQNEDVALRILFNSHPRDTQYVGAVGGGIVLGRRVQVDAAYTTARDFIVSAAVRF